VLLLRFRMVTTITRYRKKNLAFFSNPIGTISLKYKQKIHFKLFCILYSEREYTLLQSAVQFFILSLFPTHRKKMKLPQKIRTARAMLAVKNHDVGGGHHQRNFFSHQKKDPPIPHFFLTTNIHFCHELFV